ncbi:hypothetical protein D3C77_534860 [compost metagenome]
MNFLVNQLLRIFVHITDIAFQFNRILNDIKAPFAVKRANRDYPGLERVQPAAYNRLYSGNEMTGSDNGVIRHMRGRAVPPFAMNG